MPSKEAILAAKEERLNKEQRGIGYEPLLFAQGIRVEIRQWEKEVNVAGKILNTALSLVGDIDPENALGYELAIQKYGTKSFIASMTKEEGMATLTRDRSIQEQLSEVPSVTLEQWILAASLFHPGVSLNVEVGQKFDGVSHGDIVDASLTMNDGEEQVMMSMGHTSITLSKSDILSILALDIYYRAKSKTELWDKTSDPDHISIMAQKLRSELNLGFMVIRDNNVIKEVINNYPDKIDPTTLLLLSAEHKGRHLTDGNECNSCKSEAVDTISELSPERSLKETVERVSANNPEAPRLMEHDLPTYYIPVNLGVPVPNPTHERVREGNKNKDMRPKSSNADNSVYPANIAVKKLPSLQTKPVSKPREMKVESRIQPSPMSSNRELTLGVPSRSVSINRKATVEPAVQIVTMSRGESVVVAEGRSRQSTVDSGQVKTTLPRVSKVKVWERGSRREIGRTNDNPTALRSLNGRIKSESRGGRGESPHSRPSNTLDGNTRGATSAPTVHTHTKIENQITGTLLRQAIERVEAKVEVKIGTTSTSFEKKEVKAKSKTHKPILVTPVANAIREDAAPLVASIVTTPTPPNPVRATYRVRSRKGGLRVGASIALNAPNLRLDVSNGRSAKEMLLSALGA